MKTTLLTIYLEKKVFISSKSNYRPIVMSISLLSKIGIFYKAKRAQKNENHLYFSVLWFNSKTYLYINYLSFTCSPFAMITSSSAYPPFSIQLFTFRQHSTFFYNVCQINNILHRRFNRLHNKEFCITTRITNSSCIRTFRCYRLNRPCRIIT